MKYLMTTQTGEQTTVESDKSLAHLSLDYPVTTDILPIREDVIEPPKPLKAKKAKEASDAS